MILLDAFHALPTWLHLAPHPGRHERQLRSVVRGTPIHPMLAWRMVLLTTMSAMATLGTPIHPMLAWRMVLLTTMLAMTTLYAAMIVRTSLVCCNGSLDKLETYEVICMWVMDEN